MTTSTREPTKCTHGPEGNQGIISRVFSKFLQYCPSHVKLFRWSMKDVNKCGNKLITSWIQNSTLHCEKLTYENNLPSFFTPIRQPVILIRQPDAKQRNLLSVWQPWSSVTLHDFCHTSPTQTFSRLRINTFFDRKILFLRYRALWRRALELNGQPCLNKVLVYFTCPPKDCALLYADFLSR